MAEWSKIALFSLEEVGSRRGYFQFFFLSSFFYLLAFYCLFLLLSLLASRDFCENVFLVRKFHFVQIQTRCLPRLASCRLRPSAIKLVLRLHSSNVYCKRKGGGVGWRGREERIFFSKRQIFLISPHIHIFAQPPLLTRIKKLQPPPPPLSLDEESKIWAV